MTLTVTQAGRAVCASLVTGDFPIDGFDAASDKEAANLRRALRLKRRATFCLEPPGFSPPRKSMLDSILSGCIPVTFYTDDDLGSLMPFHFGGWGPNATVRVAREDVLRPGFDLIGMLRGLPAERVRGMQQSIAANAHRLMYGIGTYPGDAVETLLRVLHASSSQ